MRFRSSSIAICAKFLTFSVAEHGFRVYGACATSFAKPRSAMISRNLRTSSGSMSFARPPLGFRVKNWNVSAPIFTASSAMCTKPLTEDRWQPICSLSFSNAKPASASSAGSFLSFMVIFSPLNAHHLSVCLQTRAYSSISIGSKTSGPCPQSGHTKSSGRVSPS